MSQVGSVRPATLDGTGRSLDQATIITDIALALHRTTSLAALIYTALEKVRQLANANLGAIYLRDEAGNFTLKAYQGLADSPDAAHLHADSADSELARQATATRRIVVGRPAADDMLVAGIDPLPPISIVIPLIGQEDVIGFIHLGVGGPVDMRASFSSLLSAIGVQVGLAIENIYFSRSKEVKPHEMVLNDKVRPILDSALDTMLIVDRQAVITYANARLIGLVGLDPRSVIGRSVFQLVAEHEQRKVKAHWKSVQAGNSQEFETEFQRTDDGPVPCLVAASSIMGTDAYLLVVRDLTEAKSMQAQLIQAEKSAALGRLVAGAAHELNNPLTAVLGFAQILREETEDEMMQEDLDRIIRGALRARRVVHDLLAFARQQTPVRSDTDVNQTLESAVKDVAKRAQRSKVTVSLELDESLPLVWASGQQLKLVWDNILNNACQAMAPQGGGELHVCSERTGNYVRITISDTGPGIPMAHISRIFDPFFTTKGVGEGVGLGLSLCKGIVESHGGQIWVESAEGEGATFIVELPVPRTSPQPAV